MKRIVATLLASLAAAGCGPALKPLPDLPPPEYEPPRAFDLDNVQKPPPTATPSAAPPPTSAQPKR